MANNLWFTDRTLSIPNGLINGWCMHLQPVGWCTHGAAHQPQSCGNCSCIHGVCRKSEVESDPYYGLVCATLAKRARPSHNPRFYACTFRQIPGVPRAELTLSARFATHATLTTSTGTQRIPLFGSTIVPLTRKESAIVTLHGFRGHPDKTITLTLSPKIDLNATFASEGTVGKRQNRPVAQTATPVSGPKSAYIAQRQIDIEALGPEVIYFHQPICGGHLDYFAAIFQKQSEPGKYVAILENPWSEENAIYAIQADGVRFTGDPKGELWYEVARTIRAIIRKSPLYIGRRFHTGAYLDWVRKTIA